ncbi:MAG: hypothetical protein ONB11_07320 [candidate division KSB1 bacterium]|nr:hypothetical protein [candidate division KSB1 bacterium]
MNADKAIAPEKPVRLVFIHHSSGENWLADNNGGLGIALEKNNYFVSDTNYNWGPNKVGNRTDIGHWWEWFCDPQRSPEILTALFNEDGQNAPYSRTILPPASENEIVLFKSCFPNSNLRGNPLAPAPPFHRNSIRGQQAARLPPKSKMTSQYLIYVLKYVIKFTLGKGKRELAYTVANAKGMYIELLKCFEKHPNKLFVVITAPPLLYSATASNARAFNQWLVHDWLKNYPLKNVAVFDYFNVLTTNGGRPDVNDEGQESGNHHRWWNGTVQHQADWRFNLLAYPTQDHHANSAGNQKATAEFVPLLNVFYWRWKNSMT